MTGTPTPSVSPSPTPTAPTLPAEARGTSTASAKAFVRHYVAAVNFAMVSGDTSALTDLSLPSCSTCQAIATRIEEVYGQGGRLSGEGWAITTLRLVHRADKRNMLVAAGIEISPQVMYLSPSASPSHSARSRGNLDFWLASTSGEWLVKNLEATQ